MRNILFRAKSKVIKDIKFVYGIPYFSRGKYFMLVDNINKEQQIGKGLFEIEPETIGEFTGLYDSKSKPIFENDILQYIDSDGEKQNISVAFNKGSFVIVENGKVTNDTVESGLCLELKVIGNIHDNPELLEVK